MKNNLTTEQHARADGINGFATRKAFCPLHRQWPAAQLMALALIMTPEQSQDLRLRFVNEIRDCIEREHSGAGAILRTHLFAEQMLNAILQCNLNFTEDELDGCRFSFAQKVKLVIAQENLSSEIEKTLFALNKIRNKCAHRYYFDVNDAHWAEIFSPFINDMPYGKDISSQEDQFRWVK